MLPKFLRTPAAMLAAIASAWLVAAASSRSKRATAAAAPTTPSVAVAWKPSS